MTAITEEQVSEFIRKKAQELREATGKKMISVSCHSGLFETTAPSWIIQVDCVYTSMDESLAGAVKKALASTDPATLAANKRAEAARLIEEAEALEGARQ